MNLEWLERMLGQIWEPMVVGCLVVAAISAVLGYYGIQLFWRFHVNQKLKQRRERQELVAVKPQAIAAPLQSDTKVVTVTPLNDEQHPKI
jgi:hypothetical protein